MPYALDLYGTSFSRSGALLLVATLAWFLVGLALSWSGRRAGYRLLLGYAALQVVFYFHADVLMTLAGYGPVYQLGHARDPIVWTTFLVGDLDGLAAVAFLAYLVVRRRTILGADMARS